eukprot:gb/GFBE01048867.1/.p1 GENE.gb/GFBE01048867.1/~~gb/GFBE01048867.1/.p1  ORF type:complete len:240 (+),score=86.45 gb/GFBE01048867.1/:1-720(+)
MPRVFGRLMCIAAVLCRAEGSGDLLSNKTEVERIRRDENMQDDKIMKVVSEEDAAMEAKESAEFKAQQAVLEDNVEAEREAEVEEKRAEVRIDKAEAAVQEAEAKKAVLLAAEAKVAAAEAEDKEAKLEMELKLQNIGSAKPSDILKAQVNQSSAAVALLEAETVLREAEKEAEGVEDEMVPIEKRQFHFTSMLMLMMGIVFLMRLHLQRRKALQERLMEAVGLDGHADDVYGAYRPLC